MYKFTIGLLFFASQANAIGRALSDCLAVAALFDNTCSSLTAPIANLTTDPGAKVTCTGSMYCPYGNGKQTYTTFNPCTWTRMLCVTCA